MPAQPREAAGGMKGITDQVSCITSPIRYYLACNLSGDTPFFISGWGESMNANNDAIVAMPAAHKGMLGPYWVYLGKKYEDMQVALEVRATKLKEAGIEDPHAAELADPDRAEAKGTNDAAARPANPMETDPRAGRPEIVGLLKFIGWLTVLAGIGWMVLLWPADGFGVAGDALKAQALLTGGLVSLSSALVFGIAKVVEYLWKIEKRLAG